MKIMVRSRWIHIGLIACMGFVACTQNPEVARVGSFSIHKKDVEQNEKIIRITYPEMNGDIYLVARQQLVNAYLLFDILKNNKQFISQKDLEEEASRIERATLAPEILAKIRAGFSSDREAYLRVYVLPVLVKRIIYYNFFLHNNEIHAESFARAQSFLEQASKDVRIFNRQMSAGDLAKIRFSVSLESGLKIQSSNESPVLINQTSENPQVHALLLDRNKVHAAQEGEYWVRELVAKMKPMQVYSLVVDQLDSWWVVKLLGSDKTKTGVSRLEAVVFPKADYGAWLEKQKQFVHVELF